MVGHYHGPDGSAALGVFAPIWNIVYSLGLLAGIGGAVLFSKSLSSEDERDNSNEFFTVSIILGAILAVISTILIFFFNEPLLIFFGANEELLPLAQKYLIPIKFTIPVFVFNQLLAAFLRNDGDPALATIAVLTGGIFNIFGDWLFVFALDMGILGAGIATALGAVLSLLLMLTHFIRKRNTLKFVKIKHFFGKVGKVALTGCPTCITDVSMGIITILFNRQIMQYLGTDALAVYAIIINVSTFVQSCAYSVGQASQPIFSANYGAKNYSRVMDCLKYALITSCVMAAFWTIITLSVPNVFVYTFMTPSQSVLNIAPAIIRAYCLSFVFLPINVFSTYYFQSLLKPSIAYTISIARGCALSGALIMLLPLVFGPNSIWFAMLLAEALVMIFTVFQIIRVKRKFLGQKKIIKLLKLLLYYAISLT